MTKALTSGDIVLCRYFNTPDNHFYGDMFKARIIARWNSGQEFKVQRLDDNRFVVLKRKEIKRRISTFKNGEY